MARIIFFGSLSDRVDEAEQDFDLAEEPKTAREIFQAIGESNPKLVGADTTTPIKVAINQKLADWDTLVSEGDEVAFLPPVTGG